MVRNPIGLVRDDFKVACSSDSRILAVGVHQAIFLYNMLQLTPDTLLQPTNVLEGHQDTITSLEFSPVGNILASATQSGKTVLIWDISLFGH